MRNFHRGYKNDSANFSRGEKRGDRESRYHNNDSYKRPADKGFNRSFTDRSTRPRRDFDNNERSSFQERREGHVGNRSFGGGSRSFPERTFRSGGNKPERSFRNQTPPPRSRDRDSHADTRFNRTSDSRIRPRPQSPPSSFRRNEFLATSSRPRPTRGGPSSRRGGIGGSAGTRIIRRNDLRANLITKRTAPINRTKEYIKKIKQARMKLNESSHSKPNADDDEPRTPPKESSKDEKHDEIDEDFLDVANDINFEEDDDEAMAKNASVAKSEDNKSVREDKTEEREKASLDTSGASDDRKRRERSDKSPSKEADSRTNSVDLTCVQCLTKCASFQDFRYHLSRRTHVMSMKKVSIRVRITLNRLRKVQRDRQLEIEARLKNVENIPSKYCQICKLYFRQSKIEHRDSDDHKKIRNFLKPYCKVCHVQLLSAMKYEIHKCTLNHMKLKAKKNDDDDDEIADVEDLDIAEFKTVDSIGDVDGEEESAMDDDDDEDAQETEPVGSEFVNKIEVNYCSLCRDYLLRGSRDEKIIADHCKSKKHLRWYNQSKKRDEKRASDAKAVNGNNAGEGSKEDVVTSVQDISDNFSRKPSDKDGKKASRDSESSDKALDDSAVAKEEADDAPKKFTRYFEQ